MIEPLLGGPVRIIWPILLVASGGVSYSMAVPSKAAYEGR